MLRNYFLTALRHLLKYKSFSFINIFGLALGLASFTIIIQYVHYERSFDRINEDINNIYRVESLFFKGDQKTDHWPTSTNGYGPALRNNFPEILDYTRINWFNSDRIVRHEEIKFRENHVCFADSNFFTFFNYTVIKGNRETFLKEPNTVIISESAATKFFGKEDPMGKRLEISSYSNKFECEVSGVFRDIPANHTMQFDFLISWATSDRWMWDFWYLHESYTYVKTEAGTDMNNIAAGFPDLAENFKTRTTLKDHIWAIDFVPLKDIHLNAAKPYEIEPKGNRKAVNFLFVISFVILFVAYINYINLSTAKAMDRAREIGIRKVAGSLKQHIIWQFLLEALLTNLIASFIALFIIFIAQMALPTVLDNNFIAALWRTPLFYAQLMMVVLLGSILSGIYPALVLAGFKPSIIIKGKYKFSKGGIFLRRGLVIFQFAITITLIGSTLIVWTQINHMRAQGLGINIDRIIAVIAPTVNENYFAKIQSFKNEVKLLADINAIALTSAVPGKEVAKFLANRREHAPVEDERLFEMMKVDFDYIETFDLEFVAGRNFDKNRSTDSTALILNQAAVAMFGYDSDESAINERVILEVTQSKRNNIIGVVKNYHQQSLQKDYTPIILFMDPDYSWIAYTYYAIKINTDNLEGTLSNLEHIWNDFFPESSFDYFFLDDFFDQQYKSDRQFGKIFATFSLLAILIASMGLFGITLFHTSNRTKEIGIRKVLGASTQSIVGILNLESLKLLTIASLLGTPFTYFLMQIWMEGYSFKIEFSLWMFILPILLIFSMALMTSSYITIKASLSDPVKTLRYE